MGRTYVKDEIATSAGIPFLIGSKAPLDVRTVLDSVEDLKNRTIATSAFIGLTVYIVNESSFYVCIKESRGALTDDNVWEYWKRVDNDYSVRIVENKSDITDETKILFPYQGMMAYVTSESALYILLTKGISKSREIGNWKKISTTSSSSLDKIGIGVAPEGGSGFKITGNEGVIIDDYVNEENYIKAKYYYTSKGINSFDTDPDFKYESVRLSKGGESFIELYDATDDNWIMISDPDNSFGFNINIKDGEYVSGEPIAKGTFISFGVDINFTDSWKISYGGITEDFKSSDYELIDIYRREYSPEVYAHLKDIDVRILTEDDLVTISDKIMIDIDDSSESSESEEESRPLQDVIVQMNNQISKLEQIRVEPEIIEDSEIDKLFSQNI